MPSREYELDGFGNHAWSVAMLVEICVWPGRYEDCIWYKLIPYFFFSNATLGNPFSSFLREGFIMGVYELRRFDWSRTSGENPYTSSNKRPTHANVKDWMESCFCYALVRDLLVTSLDHAPMVLFTYREKKSYPILFKIEEIWTTDKNSSVVVTDALDRSSWFFSLQIILDQSMNQRLK